MKLSVVMPVYNENATIREIIDRVLAVPVDKEIVIVDDGSADGTRDVLQALPPEIVARGVRVFLHDRNQGKGAAVRTGLRETRGDVVIIQDADLEYDPNDYVPLLAALEAGKGDVIYGTRFHAGAKNFAGGHYWGNKMLTMFTNLLYGSRLTDMETCYKVLPGKVARSLTIRSDRFNLEPEITARLLKRGLKIGEIPVSYQGRGFDEGKKISWRDGFAAVAALIRYRFRD
jgi:glycosyltransferase involved in cell wall biosynthesis